LLVMGSTITPMQSYASGEHKKNRRLRVIDKVRR
jgi:hypothetical protein